LDGTQTDPKELTAWILAGSSSWHYGILVAVLLLFVAMWRWWPHPPKHGHLDYLAKMIGFPNYQAYLSSGHWYRMKRIIHKKYSDRCNVCAGTKDFRVHHRTYDRIGREEINDLVLLCAKCHGETHKLANTGVPLMRADLVYKARFGKRVSPKGQKKKATV
jgi:hypothetical protein